MQKTRKDKLIAYYDMFTNEIFHASKRKISEAAFYRRKTEAMKLKYMPPEQKERYLREKAHSTECECHHKMIIGGVCMYRNCRHTESEHL